MEHIARLIIFAGVGLIIIGAILLGLGKLHLPLGKLPGDIRLEGQNGSFYFPLTTSILISIILSVLLNIIARIFRK